VLSCLIFLFYLWTATSSNRPFHPRDTSQEFYNQLTDSLMQGHTYLAAKPSPQLLALPDPYDPAANERFRLHDASLYQGGLLHVFRSRTGGDPVSAMAGVDGQEGCPTIWR